MGYNLFIEQISLSLMDKGIFVVIDGIDSCGSTTQTVNLGAKLIEKGIKVHLTNEPSQLPVGKLLRRYLQNASAR